VEVVPKGMPAPCEHVVVDTAQEEAWILCYLSVEVLPKGMLAPCEHVVVDTAQGEA
jgi:hypothetical protein